MTGNHWDLHVDDDEAVAVDNVDSVVVVERDEYTVLKPLFKNGQAYNPGDKIMLDEHTAARFKALGEVE